MRVFQVQMRKVEDTKVIVRTAHTFAKVEDADKWVYGDISLEWLEVVKGIEGCDLFFVIEEIWVYGVEVKGEY